MQLVDDEAVAHRFTVIELLVVEAGIEPDDPDIAVVVAVSGRVLTCGPAAG